MKRGRSGEPAPVNMAIKVDNSREVIMRIETIYRRSFMSDISLVVGEREYPAHRLILCASSVVFETMFSPRWMGPLESRVVLTETAACEKVFGAFLAYMYTGKIQIDIINVLPVLQLADKYSVEELVVVCVHFMEKHIPRAAVSNVFISWLQYTEAAGHNNLATFCRNFTLWNISLLAECKDLCQLEPEFMIDLLQQNDLIIESELVLFKFVVSWLELRNVSMPTMSTERAEPSEGHGEDNKNEEKLVTAVMEHIRFPMMEPDQIAELQMWPIVTRYKEYFMWRLGVSMAYQKGQQVQADRLVRMISGPHGNLVFTPRLYTANLFSFSLEIEKLADLPKFVTLTYCFSSRTRLAADACPKEDSMTDWIIDVYPRGVFFDKFFVIVWQGLLECPERDKRTVRLRLTCQGPQFPLDVKVGICIFRTVNGIEHVSNVLEKKLHFDRDSNTMNIDDIIGFDELSVALLREEITDLKINLIIMPLDKYCSTVCVKKPSIPLQNSWNQSLS